MSFPLRAREMMKMRGETIFLIPVENSIKRYKNLSLSEQITTGILKRCSKEYYTLENIIDGQDGKFSFDSFMNVINFGYIPFKSKKDAQNYIEIKHFKPATCASANTIPKPSYFEGKIKTSIWDKKTSTSFLAPSNVILSSIFSSFILFLTSLYNEPVPIQ